MKTKLESTCANLLTSWSWAQDYDNTIENKEKKWRLISNISNDEW